MTDNKYIGVQGLEELIALTKNNLAKKADTLQFDVMPDPVKYTGKVVQYVGVSDVSYTRSHFYYSDGTRWTEETISGEQTTQIKIVNALPDWISADPQVLYVLKGTENKLLSLYAKNTAVNDSWYTTESSGSFAIVADLPEWYAADHNTIYFKAEGNDAALTGYIKNTEASDAWYTVGAQQEADTFLSSTSTNPVQNKVVYAAIQDVLAQIEVIDNKNNYTTEEIVIGKWIDGKPIYKKTLDLSTEAIITKDYPEGNVRWTISVNFTSLNIDSLLSYKEIKTDLYYIYTRPGEASGRTTSLRKRYFYNENNLEAPIKNISVEEHDYASYESRYAVHATGYIIVEYTKTTD